MTTRTAQTPHDTASIGESDDLALVLTDTLVDRVSVVRVVRLGDLEGLAAGRRGIRGIPPVALYLRMMFVVTGVERPPSLSMINLDTPLADEILAMIWTASGE